MPTKAECLAAIREASGISEQDARDVLEMTLEQKQRLDAGGKLDSANRRLAEWAKGQADQAKIHAALKKKHAALNVMKREALDAHLGEFLAATQGDVKEAFLSVLVGSYKAALNARKSIGATRVAISSSWIGGMMRELHTRPNVERLLAKDKRFVDDVVREMFEIRDGGSPGVTKNADAKFVADVFSKYAEASRIRMNEAGANIGKLGGWVPQSHDAARLLQAGKENWVESITGLLDLDRTFPETSPEDVRRILGDMFETIVTGRDHGISAAEKGEFVGPRNMARSMEHHRSLHFADADAWLKYQERFSNGNLVTTVMDHLDRSARKLSLMETLGPNPETMLGSLIENMQRRIREDPDLAPDVKAKRIADLSGNLAQRQGAIGRAFSEVLGETLVPEHVTGAKIAAGVRAVQSMAKLGGATLSAISDLMTYAMNARHNGVNLFQAYKSALAGLLEGRSGGEIKEIGMMLGTLYDGMLHDVSARWNVQDSVPGKLSQMMGTFFRYSGLTYWTDAMKSGYSRMLSTHLADQLGKVDAWDALDAGLKRSLAGMGFSDRHLEILRGMVSSAEDGRAYVLPENARHLDNAQLDALNADQIDAIRKRMRVGMATGTNAEKARVNAERQVDFEARLERMRADTRKQLETNMMAFFVDQTKYAVIEPDDRTRSAMVRGTRPGTLLGELVRFVTQFKSFPIAYYQRNLSGGGRWARPDTKFDPGGLAHLVAGSLVLGYAASTAKDLAKGRTPKDPTKIETWLAAAVQSGGAGIYGDFLLAKYNRFGGGWTATVAGPTLGTVDDLVTMASGALRGEAEWGDAVQVAVNNMPFVNLWYTRAAMDYAVLFHVREMISPGTLQRAERRMAKEYNQRYLLPLP